MRHPHPRPRSRLLAVWLLLPAAGLALLLQMPAQALAGLLAAACQQQCRLAETAGPWWAGRGQLFVRSPGEAQWHALGSLSWQALAGDDALFAIDLADGRAVLDRHLDIRIERLQFPASLVLGHPAWQLPATGWQGSIELSQTSIRRDGRRPGESHGHLTWRGAASGLLENHPLGDLHAAWQWHPARGLSAELDGGRADEIALSGHLHAPADGAAALTAEVTLDGESRRVLDRYLRAFAAPQADQPGRYALAWSVR